MVALVSENASILIVVTLLFSAFLLPVFDQKQKFGMVKGITITAQGLILIGAAYLALYVLSNGSFSYNLGGWTPPWGLEIVIDPLSTFFLITVGLISLPVALYALPSLAADVGGKTRATWFYTLFLLHSAALCGIALSHDLFNLYVFIEVATISGVALVAAKNQAEAIEAAFKYLVMATIGSGFIMAGIGIIYILTGNLNMAYVSAELATVWQNYPHIIWIAISFFIVGFGIKAAAFPLHSWLPDAHSSAITPASAILSGLAVKGYAIGFIKVAFLAFGLPLLNNLGVTTVLRLIGMLSIIGGSIFALAQIELKRRLAYSTIAQVGYIFLGIGLGNIHGLTGALFHLFSHALIKSALFLAAGSIITKTGKSEIKQLAGVGKKMPITMAAFTIGSLSMIGIPLFSGFLGKWSLISASLESGEWLATAVIVAGSLLAGAYLLPIIRTAFFEQGNHECEELQFSQLIPLVLIAVGVIVVGSFPGPMLELAHQAAKMLVAG